MSNATTTDPGQTGPVPPLPPPSPSSGPSGSPGSPGSSRRGGWQHVPVARDTEHGRVGGVVAGLSRSYGFDLRTTRIAVAVATVVLPIIGVAYLAAWLLLPADAAHAVPPRAVLTDRRRLPLLVALVIVAAAGGIGTFGWGLWGGLPWGVGLILLGALLWAAPTLLGDSAGTPLPPAPPTPPTPPFPGSPASPQPSAAWGAPLPADAPLAPTSWDAPATATTPTAPITPTTPTAPVPPARRRAPLDAVGVILVIGFAAVAAGGDALGWWDMPVTVGVLVGICILWVSHLMFGAVNRRWSVVPGLALLATLGIGLAITWPDLDGGIGHDTVRPATIADAAAPRHLAVGSLDLQLTDQDLLAALDDTSATAAAGPGPRTLDVDATVGYGRLHVVVPEGARLEIDAKVNSGAVFLDDDELSSGVRHRVIRTVEPAGASAASPDVDTIVLHLRVGGGAIDIDRVATPRTGPAATGSGS